MVTGDARPPSRPDESQGPWPHHSLTDESGAHGPARFSCRGGDRRPCGGETRLKGRQTPVCCRPYPHLDSEDSRTGRGLLGSPDSSDVNCDGEVTSKGSRRKRGAPPPPAGGGWGKNVVGAQHSPLHGPTRPATSCPDLHPAKPPDQRPGGLGSRLCALSSVPQARGKPAFWKSEPLSPWVPALDSFLPQAGSFLQQFPPPPRARPAVHSCPDSLTDLHLIRGPRGPVRASLVLSRPLWPRGL